MIIIYGIVLLVYLCCPKYLQLVMLIINAFVPDAILVIDEIIMVAGLVLPKD